MHKLESFLQMQSKSLNNNFCFLRLNQLDSSPTDSISRNFLLFLHIVFTSFVARAVEWNYVSLSYEPSVLHSYDSWFSASLLRAQLEYLSFRERILFMHSLI